MVDEYTRRHLLRRVSPFIYLCQQNLIAMKDSKRNELEEQAQELMEFGNSKEIAEGRGMMRVLNALTHKYSIGDKVTYIPYHAIDSALHWEDGIIKALGEPGKYFVVYNCNKDWDNYMNYTGALTDENNLKKGWSNRGI